MHAYLHINSLFFDLIIHRFISLRKISKITNKIFTLYKYSEKKLHLISMGAINRIWIKSLPIFPKFTEYSIYQKAKLNRFFDTDTTYRYYRYYKCQIPKISFGAIIEGRIVMRIIYWLQNNRNRVRKSTLFFPESFGSKKVCFIFIGNEG